MTLQTGRINFLEFKVAKEPWNEYKLEDGTVLRVKVVLAAVIKEADEKFTFSHSPVFSVRPNEKYMGIPSLPLKSDEKPENFIEADDLKFTQLTDHWNEYELPSEKILLSIKGILVSAARTSKHDERGIPIYTTNVQLIVKHKKEKS
ncbi:MAG: hypothetical protein ABSG57_05020 [Candidatus Bathyarchaeia archaeon]